MNKIKSSVLYLATLIVACLSSCSDDEVTSDFIPTEEVFETYLHLDSSYPCFDGETRATQGGWEEGDAIFITTGNTDDSWRGTATYHADVEDWTLVSNRPLSSSEQGSCSVYYFKGGNFATDGTAVPATISIDERTAIYSCSDATFCVSDNEVYLESHLAPHTWRMAFCGATGDAVKVKSLSGLKVYSELNLSAGTFCTQKKDIDLVVRNSGYTDYFYAEFIEDESTVQIMMNGIYNVRKVKNDNLKKGQTGVLYLPSSNDKKGWSRPEYVDLGLPSGTQWATCNIGASSPEEYGDYFAWGETVPKTIYDWSTYRWCNGDEYSMTKYCSSSKYGTLDNNTVLDPEDDAAYVNWGGAWRIPTVEELAELCNICSWSWITQNGVLGFRVTGTNGKSIFLPAPGRLEAGELYYTDLYGFYWSASLIPETANDARGMQCHSGFHVYGGYHRYLGLSIRPVYSEKVITHEYVDLGLPSGLKWATCNVGASSPEEYGDYFAWGETEPKDIYSWDTYKWCNGSKNSLTKYCEVDNKIILDPEDDAAYVNWGGAWRMPTSAEYKELIDQCSWTWTTQNGVKGYLVVGSNGNSIFFPAAGDSDGGKGLAGSFQSSSLFLNYYPDSDHLEFHSDYYRVCNSRRYHGCPVRPVRL